MNKIVLAILLVLLIGSLSFWVVTQKSQTTNNPAPTPTSSPAITTPTANPTFMMVKLYMVALDDSGKTGIKIGCGDSLVPVDVQLPYSQTPLKDSFEKLLNLKERNYGQSGLYNALYKSNLKVDSAVIENQVATIKLSGKLQLGGECDSPRVQSQLNQLPLQFTTVKSVQNFINGKKLEEVLSLK